MTVYRGRACILDHHMRHLTNQSILFVSPSCWCMSGMAVYLLQAGGSGCGKHMKGLEGVCVCACCLCASLCVFTMQHKGHGKRALCAGTGAGLLVACFCQSCRGVQCACLRELSVRVGCVPAPVLLVLRNSITSVRAAAVRPERACNPA